jgi:hypothetical protein
LLKHENGEKMPTRILREGILTSEKVNMLSLNAEVFYRRLMSVADDYGRYFAHPSILRANCFPLKLDDVSESDVKKMLAECLELGLVVVYKDGKYLQITGFGQQTRSKSKFPEPEKQLLIKCEANVKQMSSLDGGVVEDEDEGEDGAASGVEVVSAWNESGLVRCLSLNDTRKRHLKARLADPFFVEHWSAAVKRAAASDFCKGKNDRGWKADFDWFLQPAVVSKIMEGKYDNRGKAASPIRHTGGNY